MTKSEDILSAKNVFPVYVLLVVLFYVGYLFFFLGAVHQKYAIYLHTAIQLFIAAVLIIRYHPFRDEYVLHRADAHIIFASGVFLLFNVVALGGVPMDKVSQMVSAPNRMAT